MKRKQFRPEAESDLDSFIARYGWGISGIFDPDGNDPSFSYTTGLAAKGLPELIVFELPPDAARMFLNQLGRRLRDGEQLALETNLDDVAEGYPAQLLPVPRGVADKYMCATLRRYPDYRALQLVWTDKAGLFPWQDGFDPKLKRWQPILRDLAH